MFFLFFFVCLFDIATVLPAGFRFYPGLHLFSMLFSTLRLLVSTVSSRLLSGSRRSFFSCRSSAGFVLFRSPFHTTTILFGFLVDKISIDVDRFLLTFWSGEAVGRSREEKRKFCFFHD